MVQLLAIIAQVLDLDSRNNEIEHSVAYNATRIAKFARFRCSVLGWQTNSQRLSAKLQNTIHFWYEISNVINIPIMYQ